MPANVVANAGPSRRDKNRDVRLVSFTIDPVRDTPAVLASYGKRFGADPDRWYFLTGSLKDLHQLSRYAFMLGDIDGTLQHSTRFVLIDQQSRIRGYYDSSDPEKMAALLEGLASTRYMRSLPALNAVLNASAAVLLMVGYALIRRGKIQAHRRTMIGAFSVSVLFLISYLIYHAHVGSVRLNRHGTNRVSDDPVNPHCSGGIGAHPGDDNAVPRVQTQRCTPPPNCPLDAAHLALRQHHWRCSVLDVVQNVADRWPIPPKPLLPLAAHTPPNQSSDSRPYSEQTLTYRLKNRLPAPQ